MLKQTLIAAAAIAFAAVPAFAHSGTMNMDSFDTTNTTTNTWSADVNNSADVSNDVYTFSNTGFNYTSANGGDTSSTTTAVSGDASGDTTGGGTKTKDCPCSSSDIMGGGNMSGDATAASLTGGGDTGNWVSTGDASSTSTVTNVVNTTFIHF